MILFDIKCNNPDCSEYQKIEVDACYRYAAEKLFCRVCSSEMIKILGYKLGIVKDGTPHFHKK